MKTLVFFVLDVFACLMLLVAQMRIGPCGTQVFGPDRLIDIAFTIGGFLLFFVVGNAAPPLTSSYGSFRGLALFVFLLATISLPVNIHWFVYNLRHAANPAALIDPDDVTRGLIRGFSGLSF
jgi:hypothetical protein